MLASHWQITPGTGNCLPCRAQGMGISVVPVGTVHDAVIDTVQSVVNERFQVPVKVAGPLDIPDDAYVSTREQYRGELLLKMLEQIDERYHQIGITIADMYFQDRDYVFGLAETDGNALVSCARLTRTRDGTKTVEPGRVTARIRKEVVHELGHVYGLRHCTNRSCVMSFSGDVEGIDQKSDTFCRVCMDELSV